MLTATRSAAPVTWPRVNSIWEEGRGRSRGGPDRLGGIRQRLQGGVKCAVELGLFGDRLRQLGLYGGALAAREIAAAQLGPQLLDMVVEGDHRALLPSQKTGGGRHAGLGRVKDAAGAAPP